jgi:hypothetical protein
MKELAQAIDDCYDQASTEDRFITDKPPHSIGLTILTQGGGKILVKAQSATKLSDSKPDPETVEMVDVAEFPDGNLNGQPTVELSAFVLGGLNSGRWYAYWRNSKGDSVTFAGGTAYVGNQTIQGLDAQNIENQILEEMTGVAGTKSGDLMPPIPMPTYGRAS